MNIQMPEQLIRDKNITPGAKIAYACLKMSIRIHGNSVSVSTIIDTSGGAIVSTRNLVRQIRQLESRGWIKTESNPGTSNTYSLFDNPNAGG